MLKILLTSDIHLGFKETEGAHIPENTRMETFKRICRLALEHDILLIAGDLFHSTEIPEDLVNTVAREFKNLKDQNIEIIYTPGDHELHADGSPARFINKLNATHLFSSESESPYSVMINDETIHFYGLPAGNNNLITQIRKTTEAGLHIGVYHAAFTFNAESDNEEMYSINKKHIRALDLDFYALGHQHYFKLYKLQSRIIAASPGSPEAISFNETDDRYVLSISVLKGEINQIKRLVINSLKVKKMILDCEDISSQSEIEMLIARNRSKNLIFELEMAGKRKITIDMDSLNKYSKDFFKLMLIDSSYPALTVLIKDYTHENSLRGEFFRHLKKTIDENTFPNNISESSLSKIMHRLSQTGIYEPEEWICK